MRPRAIRSLYLAGGYRNEKPWAFGPKALAKDLGYGLVAPSPTGSQPGA